MEAGRLYSEYEGIPFRRSKASLFSEAGGGQKAGADTLEECAGTKRNISPMIISAGLTRGRGPLAGPVVAAAVILPKDCQILYINDSKNFGQKREELYGEIMEKAFSRNRDGGTAEN